MFRVIIALILITYGVFGTNLNIKFPLPKPQPEPVAILNIEKPSAEIMQIVHPLSSLVTDPTDRAKIAIFNYEFATRVKNYNSDLQQVNDVYTLAGKIFFKNEMVGKYKGLGDGLIKLLTDLVSDDNHDLSQAEKEKISAHFMGLCWSLIQKN